MGQLPRIFLIRHGETEWNRQGRFQGRKNSAQTEDGRKQVERIGRRLALDIGRCGQELAAVCSPLGRCIESAKIVSGCVEVSWKLDDRLVEFTANYWDGALTREIQAELGVDPPQIYACLDRIGGEGFDSVSERVRSWLDEIRTDTLCITHGAVGRIICDLYAGLGGPRVSEPLSQDGYYVLQNGGCFFRQLLLSSDGIPRWLGAESQRSVGPDEVVTDEVVMSHEQSQVARQEFSPSRVSRESSGRPFRRRRGECRPEPFRSSLQPQGEKLLQASAHRLSPPGGSRGRLL